MKPHQSIEQHFNFKLPKEYLKFGTNIGEEIFEVPNTSISLYPLSLLIERNMTYDIQTFEPNAILIGQDGDLGFFIRRDSGENIFELGLGALGSLEMRLKGNDIYDFQDKIQTEYLDED